MEKKVGLLGLIAIVVGSMVGGGVFQLPSEMAKAGRPFAVIIAWLITGIGMFFIGKVFQVLSDKKSELSGGIYTYAKVGFGDYIGFNSAWGYWLSHLMGNVSYIVLFLYALHNFLPQMGNFISWTSVIISVIMIWGILFIIAKSMAIANKLNVIATIGKLIPIVISIFLLFLCFKLKVFTHDFYGAKYIAEGAKSSASVFEQVKNAMLNAVWTFTGIETAVVISARAKNKKDVGKATIIGYVFTLVCYVLIVLLSFGALTQNHLINLKNPSLGGVLLETYGPIGSTIINVGVIISVVGAWVAWTIVNAEVPMTVAQDKVFPKALAKKLKSGAAINSLILNAFIMQIIFLVAMFANDAFSKITDIATMMVLLPYIMSALYLIKLSIKEKNKKHISYGVIAILFSLYALSTAGFDGIAKVFIFYALGIIFIFIRAKEQKEKLFKHKWEMYTCFAVTIIGVISAIYTFI